MSALIRRLDRLAELVFLASHHAAGVPGLRALWRCYAATLGDPMAAMPVELPLRWGSRRATLSMRASDIYTVAEIFRERQYALAHELPPAPVIVDAGANIGVAATWFRLRHPDATIIAIEPVRENHEWLLRNLGDAARSTAVRAALGREAGMVTMQLARHGAEHAVGTGAGERGSEEVVACRLDELLQQHGHDRVDLLKLDVEGSEIDALLGLGEMIDRVGGIVAEVHERQIDVDAFYALLKRHGFAVVRRRYYREGEASGVHTMEAWRRAPQG